MKNSFKKYRAAMARGIICQCEYPRWKTVEKGKVYECRLCGQRREIGK